MSDRPRYWLMKSEEDCYSIQHLAEDGKTHWDGVRNYQARNFMRDDMKVGDLVLYYHSNAKPSGVAGIARVCREAYPDFTAWDPNDKHFDPKSPEDNPRWMMVDLEHVETFPRVIGLKELKENPELEGMLVLKRGQRLSVMPVEKEHYEEVLAMGREAAQTN